MATLTDITTTPYSGLNHIDALLDKGPDWNFLGIGGNVITYTFSTSSDMEAAKGNFTGAATSFSATQQASARSALAYLSVVTGVKFVESASGASAQLHFADANLSNANTTGLCSWTSHYWQDEATGQVTGLDPEVYVYLDNAEWAGYNAVLNPGSGGYETLLHELGHAMGLKHPFEDSPNLPGGQDNTALTLMSYTDVGGPYAVYQAYDLAALNWLYGGDGLGGALGIGSSTGARYLTGSDASETLNGTKFNDTLQGEGGNDMINGGEGTDTAVFNGARGNYRFQLDGETIVVSGTDGVDTLNSVELLRFSDSSVSRDMLLDTTAPAAPTGGAQTNAAHFISGDTPLFVGNAEANSTVNLYNGATLIGTAATNAKGLWYYSATTFQDGNYSITATAVDAAGNESVRSPGIEFKVDAHAPAAPSGAVAVTAGSNQPTFTGTGEAGTEIDLINVVGTVNTVVGITTVGADGTWKIASNPLINGAYNLTVQSVDLAENFTNSAKTVTFNVASSLNQVGTNGKDVLTGTSGNNAIDGAAGIDTGLYAGLMSGYVVKKSAWGYTVTSGATGTDTLVNVERIKFDNATVAIDIDGVGGQAYRLYNAAFDRTPDKSGVGFWMNALEHGVTLDHIAGEFLTSPEFQKTYGPNQTNSEFLTTLYGHVLGRTPDASGFQFWLDALNVGVDRAHILAQFSESPENQLQVIGTIQNGFEYTPWVG